jgi:alpha-glucan,water dikinase
VAVITSDAVDVLCHAAVRARNSSVLVASCSQQALLEELRQLSGKYIYLTALMVSQLESGWFAQEH